VAEIYTCITTLLSAFDATRAKQFHNGYLDFIVGQKSLQLTMCGIDLKRICMFLLTMKIKAELRETSHV
jgi:hypothetical protein